MPRGKTLLETQAPPEHRPEVPEDHTTQKVVFSGLHLVWIEDEGGDEYVSAVAKGQTVTADTVPDLLVEYAQVLKGE